MQNKYGIAENSYNYLLETLIKYNTVFEAKIFGSRAMGNFKKGSDIDLAISGDNIQYDTLLKISSTLNEELPIPYYVDVIHFESITNSNLKKHIEIYGKTIYKKED